MRLIFLMRVAFQLKVSGEPGRHDSGAGYKCFLLLLLLLTIKVIKMSMNIILIVMIKIVITTLAIVEIIVIYNLNRKENSVCVCLSVPSSLFFLNMCSISLSSFFGEENRCLCFGVCNGPPRASTSNFMVVGGTMWSQGMCFTRTVWWWSLGGSLEGLGKAMVSLKVCCRAPTCWSTRRSCFRCGAQRHDGVGGWVLVVVWGGRRGGGGGERRVTHSSLSHAWAYGPWFPVQARRQSCLRCRWLLGEGWRLVIKQWQ